MRYWRNDNEIPNFIYEASSLLVFSTVINLVCNNSVFYKTEGNQLNMEFSRGSEKKCGINSFDSNIKGFVGGFVYWKRTPCKSKKTHC